MNCVTEADYVNFKMYMKAVGDAYEQLWVASKMSEMIVENKGKGYVNDTLVPYLRIAEAKYDLAKAEMKRSVAHIIKK